MGSAPLEGNALICYALLLSHTHTHTHTLTLNPNDSDESLVPPHSCPLPFGRGEGELSSAFFQASAIQTKVDGKGELFGSAIKFTVRFAFPAWAKSARSPWGEGWDEGIRDPRTESFPLALVPPGQNLTFVGFLPFVHRGAPRASVACLRY